VARLNRGRSVSCALDRARGHVAALRAAPRVAGDRARQRDRGFSC